MAGCTQVQAGDDELEEGHAARMVAEPSSSQLASSCMGSLQVWKATAHCTPSTEAAVWDICHWYVVMYNIIVIHTQVQR